MAQIIGANETIPSPAKHPQTGPLGE
jgi:hypothetical protein